MAQTHICHSERSEESRLAIKEEILRLPQDDIATSVSWKEGENIEGKTPTNGYRSDYRGDHSLRFKSGRQ